MKFPLPCGCEFEYKYSPNSYFIQSSTEVICKKHQQEAKQEYYNKMKERNRYEEEEFEKRYLSIEENE